MFATQYAWQCDDRDCPVQWHQGQFDLGVNDEGKPIWWHDQYNDGDWEPDYDVPGDEEFMTDAQVQKTWDEYRRWVAQTGEDPLGDFPEVKTEIVKVQTWKAQIVPIIGFRLAVARTKLAHHPHSPANTPQEVLLWLTAEKSEDGYWVLQDVKTMDELKKLTQVSPKGWVTTDPIEIKIPRNPNAIREDFKRAARARLKVAF